MKGDFRASLHQESGQQASVVVAKSPLQCAGVNRHEGEDERALRVRSSDPLGPESCAATASANKPRPTNVVRDNPTPQLSQWNRRKHRREATGMSCCVGTGY
jgi:hypothetical protein